MTKTVRIENACNSNWPVRVTVQNKDAEGNWIDQPGPKQLDHPTFMTEQYLTSHRRLVIEERPAEPAAAPSHSSCLRWLERPALAQRTH